MAANDMNTAIKDIQKEIKEIQESLQDAGCTRFLYNLRISKLEEEVNDLREKKSKNQGNKNKRCWYCGKRGHLKRECKQKMQITDQQ